MATAQTLDNANAADTGTGSTKTGVAPCALRACEIGALLIECSHKDRPYIMVVPGEPTRNGRDYVMQVISSSNAPEVMKLMFNGKCDFGHPGSAAESTDAKRDVRPNRARACPSVAVTGHQVVVDQPTDLHVRVYPKLERVDESFTGFLQHYLFPTLTPSVYTVQSKKCTGSGQLAATIEAFPPFKVSGKFGISYVKKSDPSRPVAPKGVTSRHLDQAQWKIEGTISCKVDQHQWKIGAERETTRDVDRKLSKEQDGPFGALRKQAGAFFGFLDQVHEHYEKNNQLTSDRSYTVEVTYPSFELSVESSLKELKEKYNVGLECSATVTVTFIQAKIECDIISVLLERGGPVANFIQFVREQLAKEIKDGPVDAQFKLGVLLTVQGKIAGELKFEKTADISTISPTGSISGEVGLGARGFIQAEGKVFMVTVAAGASVELQGAETKSDPASVGAAVSAYQTKDGKFGMRGQLKGNGLAIYYVAYYKVAVKKSENKAMDKPNMSNRGTKKSVDLDDKKEKEGKYVLFDPWAWPKAADGELAQALS